MLVMNSASWLLLGGVVADDQQYTSIYIQPKLAHTRDSRAKRRSTRDGAITIISPRGTPALTQMVRRRRELASRWKFVQLGTAMYNKTT